MLNLWFNRLVAFAYQYQREATPYKQLIADFASFLPLRGNETVLDIGCGSGKIMETVWEKSKGMVKRIVGLDCSKTALEYARDNLAKICSAVNSRMAFISADISQGLPFERLGQKGGFDLVTAGLSIQYAENWDGKHWTQKAYRQVIQDIFEALKPGGSFVFSVNTPNPDFSQIAKKSWREIIFSWRLPFNLFVAAIMVWQGKWLTNQARIGHFHYLPIEDVEMILRHVGFQDIKYKLTYAGLAWVVSCQKPPN